VSDDPQTPATSTAPAPAAKAAVDSGTIPPLAPGQLRRGLILGAIILALIIAVDRATLLLVPPQYRGISDARRYHELYFSQKIAEFNRVKKDLRLVVLGDSRSRHGIDPALFADQKDNSRVTAFNLAPASSGIEFTDLIVHDYLADLPRLDTIVWGTSPRIFNRYWDDPVYPLFKTSKGYVRDVDSRQIGSSPAGVRQAVDLGFGQVMSTLFASYAHRSILKAKVVDIFTSREAPRHFTVEPPMSMNGHGFMEFPQARDVNFSDPASVQGFLDSVQGGRFQLAENRWLKFEALVKYLQSRRIRLLCFVPPMHTSLARSPAADADGTPRADYESLVARMKGLESEYDNFRFVDVNKAGDSGFADSEFGDWDHLNLAGAARLSGIVDEDVRTAFLTKPPAVAQVTTSSPDLAGKTTPPAVDPAPQPVKTSKDQTAPKLACLLGELDYAVRAYPPDNRPTLWVDYTDEESGVDTATARFFINNEDVTAKCQITPTRISYTPAKSLPVPKLYHFKVTVSDKAGNQGEITWEILLKPC